jgi:hypothetical protein
MGFDGSAEYSAHVVQTHCANAGENSSRATGSRATFELLHRRNGALPAKRSLPLEPAPGSDILSENWQTMLYRCFGIV